MDQKGLAFTGERFIPGQGGAQMLYEHVHRYLLSGLWAPGAHVLDVASGEGYGSFFLAQAADSVTGFDLDAETVAHAAATYHRPNLSFMQASADSLPFRAQSFDLVVAFEIIEHLQAQETTLAEIARVLRPAGLALISTPNKKVYSDDRHYVNPFHVREFYLEDFVRLLRDHFPHVLLLGQKLVAGSLIWPLAPAVDSNPLAPRGTLHTIGAEAGRPDISHGLSAQDPMYVIAVCSPAPLPAPPFLPAGLLDTTGAYVAELQEQGRWVQRVDAEIKEKDQLILKLQSEIESLSHWGDRLAIESDEKDATILRQQKEFEERTSWALRLDAECREKDKVIGHYQEEKDALSAQLVKIQRTFVYRALRKLGALP